MSTRDDLRRVRSEVGLNLSDLWWAYLSLGGSLGLDRFRHQLSTPSTLSTTDYNLIAVALNDHHQRQPLTYETDD